MKTELAAESGAFSFSSTSDGIDTVLDWTDGVGADAVLVAAATESSAPMRMSAALARDRATIVAVGDVGLDLDRRPLYEKELTVKVSRAYGPGRYDPSYENLGIDYPIGFVRWPIGRNLEAVMGLIASGRLEVNDLITHRFPFDRAVEAYDVFDSGDPYLGILLEYGEAKDLPNSSIRLAERRRRRRPQPIWLRVSSAPGGSPPECSSLQRPLPGSGRGLASPRPEERPPSRSAKPMGLPKRSPPPAMSSPLTTRLSPLLLRGTTVMLRSS